MPLNKINTIKKPTYEDFRSWEASKAKTPTTFIKKIKFILQKLNDLKILFIKYVVLYPITINKQEAQNASFWGMINEYCHWAYMHKNYKEYMPFDDEIKAVLKNFSLKQLEDELSDLQNQLVKWTNMLNNENKKANKNERTIARLESHILETEDKANKIIITINGIIDLYNQNNDRIESNKTRIKRIKEAPTTSDTIIIRLKKQNIQYAKELIGFLNGLDLKKYVNPNVIDDENSEFIKEYNKKSKK